MPSIYFSLHSSVYLTCSPFMASPMLCVLLLLVFPFQITAAQTKSNITLNSSLTANDNNSSWSSPLGDFAFGFRSLEGVGFLLAIWFDKIPEKTIVWSANRDSPVPQGSKVELNTDGRLVLSDPQGTEIWSPNLNGSGVNHAAMLDAGNFVLANQDDENLWETFTQPTDTILPTQTIVQGGSSILVSRYYSDKNYSRGRFQLSIKSDGNLVLSLRAFPANSTYGTYWSTDTTGSGYKLIFNQNGNIYLIAENGTMVKEIANKKVSSEDLYQRAVLDYDGVFRQYTYPKTTNRSTGRAMAWTLASSPIPVDICMSVMLDNGGGACGFNSYCILDDEQQRPRCECPEGYMYLDPENEMNGCKPTFEPQSCEEGMSEADNFMLNAMINADWPLSDYEHYKVDENQCRQWCLNDCFCYLAIFNDDGCWKKRMPFSNGRINPSIGGTALIKVRKVNSTSTHEGPKDGWKKDEDAGTLIIIGSVLSTSAALNLLLIFVTVLLWCRYQPVGNEMVLQPPTVSEGTSMQNFSYKELKEATDGFKEELGKGAFGAVYRGVISSSQSTSLVAVKVLKNLTDAGEKEFKAEMNTIGSTNHKNLVQLLGFCNEGQNRFLVYEFMQNGSLANYLFGTPRPSWYRRVEIAFGVVRGLLYLHEECSKQIIHCDIKPQNVLLDNSFTAKISDFGLAKLLMIEQTQTQTAVRGTKGYISPEWFRNMPISVKVDVYSFGILLLELICCRKNCELEMKDENQVILSDWIFDCYHEGVLYLLVQDDEAARGDMRRVQRFAMTAMWCIQDDPSLRPPMKKIIQMLEGAVEVSAPPVPSYSSFIDAT